jgi:serine/threonine-protein kinase HipA
VSSKAIEVRIWDQSVGAVALDPANGYYLFAYRPEWVKRGIELAPRTMPVANYHNPYFFSNLNVETYHRLPAMLADALPDAFGNALINQYLLSKGRTLESITTLDRLAYMGKRGMGALEFRPAIGTRTDSTEAIEMQTLVEAARAAVRGELSTEATASKSLKMIISVGTSAGGARAKAVIAWNPATNEVRSGQFAVEPGFEHWLLKFDGMGPDTGLGPGRDYGKLEYVFHLMARAAGIQMMDCRLLRENGRAHFMTRRFDRDGNTKLHLQSLCAMEHMDFKLVSAHSYAQAFMAIASIGLDQDATDELFRRMAFNVMVRNCDDHTKNLAFLLREGQPWELAPAYDVAQAYNPQGDWTNQHQMSVNGKFRDISRKDLLMDAERFGVRSPLRILEVVSDAVESFGRHAKDAEIPTETVDAVRSLFVKL